jgi:predicted transcriptional regulator
MYSTRLSGDNTNLGEEIVLALRRYGAVPIEFLSKLTGRDTPTLERYLTTLEEKEVVKREDQKVKLNIQDV